jgi:hypothetical protein
LISAQKNGAFCLLKTKFTGKNCLLEIGPSNVTLICTIDDLT